MKYSKLVIFKKILDCKKRLIQLHHHSNSGHIGSNLSCLDALVVLHHSVMLDNDRFILSKGHSAGALYITLWSLGRITDDQLDSFSKDDSFFPGHPSGTGIPGLLFPTGSLGHGPSISAGLALASKTQNLDRKIYCLCSDGEWQEGSCWEALIFSVHNKLSNLTILIDQNGLQGFGTTEEVISCSDLTARISSFGVPVLKCNGHDPGQIYDALASPNEDLPKIIILQTCKGNGTLFENKLESHYLPFSSENYNFSLSNLEPVL